MPEVILMNVRLSPELERLIAEKVASGEYGSPTDVVSEGLRLLARRDEANDEWLDYLADAAQKGIDSGPAKPFTAEDVRWIKAEGRRRLESPGD